jgi:lycopene beta-cyclase
MAFLYIQNVRTIVAVVMKFIWVVQFVTTNWIVCIVQVNGFTSATYSHRYTTISTSSPIDANLDAYRVSFQVIQRRGRPQWNTLAATKSTTTTSKSGDTTSGNQYDEICDVLVIGSGPAARAIASLLSTTTTTVAATSSSSSTPLDVLLADRNLDRLFPPNYGVWQDEWDTVIQRYADAGVTIQGGKASAAVDRKWSVTDCYFGGSFDVPVSERMRTNREYYRIDKDALRESLLPSSAKNTNQYRQIKANHFSQAMAPNIYGPPGSLTHDTEGTTIQLRTTDEEIITVRTKLVVDCTGHETQLVLRESNTREASQPPGFQIAYGCLVDVECDNTNMDSTRIGPYDKEAMTLFDYRTDHYDSESTSMQQKVAKSPTFMYAMPLRGNQIFFEETSLVARPALSFQECKDRTMQRLAYHGIRITKLYEEEFCYIPMGGALPARNQRIVALGGAAAMVHPATGYHICRCLIGAADIATIIRTELLSSSSETGAIATTTAINLDRIAALAYNAVWSPSNIRQRNFSVYGGEYLMKQNVVGLRGFFSGFFKLPLPLWAGFLAGWPGLPNNENHETWLARLWFGLNFITRLPPSVALDMTASIISYIATTNLALAQSVTPLLGEPASYEYQPNEDAIGDVAAKNEARQMIQASKVFEDVPVDFEVKKQATRLEESFLQRTTR